MHLRRAILFTVCSICAYIAVGAATPSPGKPGEVQLWLTNYDKSALFAPQPPLIFSKPPSTATPTISVDDAKTFQPIDGFGFALTGGSAQDLAHMDAAKRAALLHELFATDANNIGISYLASASARPTSTITSTPTTMCPPAKPILNSSSSR